MSRQHEPPAGEATPAVGVRRAVSVPVPGQDPGADLRPGTPESAAAADPAAGPDVPVSTASGEEPARGRRSRWRSRSRTVAAEPEAEQAAVSEEAEAEAVAGAVVAGSGDSAAANADGTPPGRLRGPMVAAAAIAGAVLICVPLLILALGGEDDDRTVETASVGGTTLDPDMAEELPAADYRAASPSPSVSPSAAESASGSPAGSKSEPLPPSPVVTEAEVKAEPRSGSGKKDDDEAEPKAEKSPPITARQLANAVSSRVNAQLKNVATGKCADLPYFDRGSVDGPVSQYNCRPTTKDNQLWALEVADRDGGPQGASLFVIKNRKDGMCMDLPNYGSVAPGTRVSEYHCHRTDADNQLWWLDPRPGGYLVRNLTSNLCMSVTGGASAGNDARLQVANCGAPAPNALRWLVVDVVKPS